MPHCRFAPRLLLTLGGIFALVLAAEAANWPRFRGPNGTGIAEEKDIPVAWGAKDIRWKVVLPGTGNSSPVIWGDHLFVQSASTDGKERYLLCLNTADGKETWRQTLAGKQAGRNEKNSLASSTPATDGERVYAYFWDGTAVSLHAFDFNGKPLWTYKIGKFSSDHGAGSSPMVYDGKVFFLNDQGEGAFALALDAKSGTKVWEAKREHFQKRACYSTPFVLERKGQPTELIVASTMAITSYSPDTGAQNWQYQLAFDGRPLRMVAGPVATPDGLIAVNTGDGDGSRKSAAIVPGNKATGTAPSLAWEVNKPKLMPYVPCFLSCGEHLYWVNDQGYAGCTVAKTGQVIWTERLRASVNVTASPVLIDGKVYAVGEGGDVFVFAAEPRYKLLARNPLGEPVLASPAVADGKLYIRGKEHLYCIGK